MISIVVPCFNEYEVLPALYKRVTEASESWKSDYEVVIVDDGSQIETWIRLKEIHEKDKRWKIIRFSRNFGHQLAVSAGLHYSSGDCVIIIDADLQDPPEELIRFINKWKEGYEVVYGIRTKRKENIFKKIAYKLFYRILGKLSNIPIPYDSGDFCLMDRKVVDLVRGMPEQNRFVRGLRAWVGFKQIGLEYERESRHAGEPKYTFKKLVNLAVDGIFSFSTVPLRLVSYLGFSISFLAMAGALYTFLMKIFDEWLIDMGYGIIPRGFTTITISVLFLGGVQLISIGILGEYLGRIYDEVKKRPHWVISESYGVATSDEAID